MWLLLYFSITYISPRRREIGTLPIVSLKNNISIVVERIARSDGNRRSKRPKRVGWRGYRNRTWSDRMHWAWSCSISTGWTSQRRAVSVEEGNKMNFQSLTIGFSTNLERTESLLSYIQLHLSPARADGNGKESPEQFSSQRMWSRRRESSLELEDYRKASPSPMAHSTARSWEERALSTTLEAATAGRSSKESETELNSGPSEQPWTAIERLFPAQFRNEWLMLSHLELHSLFQSLRQRWSPLARELRPRIRTASLSLSCHPPVKIPT